MKRNLKRIALGAGTSLAVLSMLAAALPSALAADDAPLARRISVRHSSASLTQPGSAAGAEDAGDERWQSAGNALPQEATLADDAPMLDSLEEPFIVLPEGLPEGPQIPQARPPRIVHNPHVASSRADSPAAEESQPKAAPRRIAAAKPAPTSQVRQAAAEPSPASPTTDVNKALADYHRAAAQLKRLNLMGSGSAVAAPVAQVSPAVAQASPAVANIPYQATLDPASVRAAVQPASATAQPQRFDYRGTSPTFRTASAFSSLADESLPTPAPIPRAGASARSPRGGMPDQAYRPMSVDPHEMGGPAYEEYASPYGPGYDHGHSAFPDPFYPEWRRHGRIIGGAEYLHVRPHFSEAYAMTQQVLDDPDDENDVDTDINFDYSYDASYRAYLGYRLDDCCSEIRFTYWNLSGDASSVGTAGTDADGNPIVFTAFEVNAVIPGQQLIASSSVDGRVYDWTFSRCIRVGDDCCDPCDGCASCCPNWELTWLAGVRLADWDWDYNVRSTATGTDTSARATMDFIGAGPMVGLGAKRYFGPCLSVYANWDLAILLGDYENNFSRTAVASPITTTRTFLTSTTRTVPVTEIEFGANWQATRHISIGAGYFFQVWWDLGMTDDPASDIGGVLFVRDDSNIMSWDGLAVRAEVQF